MMKGSFFERQRGCDCVKLLISSGELGIRPIKFFSNLGSVHKSSTLAAKVKELKKAVGDPTGNGICYVYYYAGSRVIHPFHVHWMGDRFELTIYDPFGESNNRFFLSRTVESDNERFTAEEINRIGKYLETQHHIMSSAYEFAMDIFGKRAKNYNEVFQEIANIRSKLNET